MRSTSLSARWPHAPLWAGLTIFIISRFFSLEDFPIYFFCDEAFIGSQSRYLLDNHLHDPLRRILPMYFEKAANRWVPQISLYLSMPAMIWWPHSIFALRAVSAIIATVSAGLNAATYQRLFPHSRWWWLGLMFLTVTPVWFLHSRTAFESPLALMFFGIFIAGYLRYRVYDPGAIWIALAGAVCMFYAHLGGSIVTIASTVMLGLIDIRYHWSQRHRLLSVFCVGVICFVPCLIWLLQMPNALGQQLSTLNSGWMSDRGFLDVFKESFPRYIHGLDPFFWFSEGPTDQLRHIWKGRPQIPLWSLPLISVGILRCLRFLNRPVERTLLVLLLLGATPTLVVESHIQRIFYLIAPLSFIVMLGADTLWHLVQRIRITVLVPPLAFGALSFQAVVMTKEAVYEAPRWFSDYGLYGLQWGAKELFRDTIPTLLTQYPDSLFIESGDWANGAEEFPWFFLEPEQRKRLVRLGFELMNPPLGAKIPQNMIFIRSEAELKEIVDSQKFKPIDPLLTIPFPDGRPGFYFTRLQYRDDIDELIRTEREFNVALIDDSVTVEGAQISVRYSRLDLGQIQNVFDRKIDTVARTKAANPFILEIKFPAPVLMKQLTGAFWSMSLRWNVAATLADGTTSTFSGAQRVEEDGITPIALPLFEEAKPVSALRIEIMDSAQQNYQAHIHIREIHWSE